MRRVISRGTKGKADVVNYDYLEGTIVEDAVKEGMNEAFLEMQSKNQL